MRLKSAASAGLALVCAVAPAVAQTCAGVPGPAKLRIEVEGVRSDQGLMTATLYPDDSAKFLRTNGQLVVWRVPAKAPVTQMCVWLPAPGRYALVVYDDLNFNHHFDHTAIAPLEPYGFSNNPRIFLIPPSADSTAFTVGPGETMLNIRLRYPGSIGRE